MEGRRKLKFGEVSLQICQKFLRKKLSKNFFNHNALLKVYFQVVFFHIFFILITNYSFKITILNA